QYTYTAWGETQADTGIVVRPRMAGREYDQETGLYYNRARYYDPKVGRVLSEDPAGTGAGLNLYTYAGNDPVNGLDPSGLSRGVSCEGWVFIVDGVEVPCTEELSAAGDAWFMANYGFGLRDAMNGTHGECTFSGGSIDCPAGSSFDAAQGQRPSFFVVPNPYLGRNSLDRFGCPDGPLNIPLIGIRSSVRLAGFPDIPFMTQGQLTDFSATAPMVIVSRLYLPAAYRAYTGTLRLTPYP